MNVQATPVLKAAIEANREYILAETLTVELKYAEPVARSVTITDEFDGEKLSLGLVKVKNPAS